MDSPRFSTATELARASGTDRFSVRRALAAVEPATRIVRDGNKADAWHTMDIPEELRDKADPYDLRALAGMVELWVDPNRPTDADVARLLDCAFLKLDTLVQQGASERPIKARLLKWLAGNVPALGANDASLRRNFNRYLARWRNGGKKPGLLYDARSQAGKNRRAPKLPKADLDRLVAYAVIKHGGRLYPTWRKEWKNLSEETRNRYPIGEEVPRKIRQQALPLIRILQKQHIGPRGARLNGCYIERDYSNVFAGDWYSSDDVTLPVYCYHPENPQKLLRGQFLPMIDVKSQRILDFVFVVSESYTAADIRALITRVCDKYGLPRCGFHFECGIWKDAKILGGGSKCDPSGNGVETFATRLGLHIINSLPGNARAKIIERLIGILQNMMEGEPGYVGRNEMVVKYELPQKEILDVRSGRIHPSDFGFFSIPQWHMRLQELCEEYNATTRKSRVMGGKMSPDEAWQQRQATNADGTIIPLVKLPPDLRYLLAAHKELVNVGRAGIRMFNGQYRYVSEITGALEGQTVFAWFDPENPELLSITDLNGENVRTIPRIHPLPAYNAWELTPELARESTMLVNAHNGFGRRLYGDLKARFFPKVRPAMADTSAIQKGKEMKRQRDEFSTQPTTAQQAEEDRRRRMLDELDSPPRRRLEPMPESEGLSPLEML